MIKNKPGANTTVQCDAPSGCSGGVPYGAPMPMTFDMSAIVPKISGGTVSASITPLSHMAAVLAANGMLDEANIDAANKKMAELFNLAGGLLATKPVDVTDAAKVQAAETGVQADALKLSFLSAAIAELASTKNAGNIAAALTALATSYAANNGELVQNSADNTKITLSAITGATQTAVAKYETVSGRNLTNTLVEDDIAALKTDADGAAPDSKTTTIVPTDAQLADAIAKAKTVVTTLRTWITELAKLEEGSKLFEGEIKTAGTVSGLATDSVGMGVDKAFGVAYDAYAAKQNQSATLGVAGKTFTMQSNDKLGFACDGTFFVNGSSVGWYVVVGRAVYLSGSVVANMTSSSNVLAVGSEVSYAGSGAPGSDRVASVVTDSTCSMSTALSDWINAPSLTNVTGTVVVSGSTVAIKGGYTDAGKPVTVDLNFTMPAWSGSTFTAGVSGTAGVTDRATLTIANTSTVKAAFASSLVLPDEVSVMPMLNSASFRLDATIAQGTKDDLGNAVIDPVSFKGVIAASGVRSGGNMVFNPSSMTLEGEFSSVAGKSFKAGLTAIMANASSFVPVTGARDGESSAIWRQVSARLTLDASGLTDASKGALPKATVTVDVKRTGLDAGEGSVTISYGKIGISVIGSGNRSTQQGSASIVVRDASNVASPVELTITPNVASNTFKGSVKVGSAVVGSLTKAVGSPVMTYVDGSFETVAL